LDLTIAGPTLPQPQFYDVGAVLVAGATKRLVVRDNNFVGVSNAVRCTGNAPALLEVDGNALRGSRGGALVQSDTAIPRLSIGINAADHLFDVPDGGVVNVGRDGWYK